MMKKGFTLVELLVVVAMIAVLTGAVSSAVTSARKRANIARATVAVREMTNAILAYENYTDDHTLREVATGGKESGSGWQEATESSIGFLLGGKSNSGGKIPVLYNAHVVGGRILDPWGHPYYYKVADAGDSVDKDKDKLGKNLKTFLYLPNMYRIRAQ